MDFEIKRRWITALRSRKYKQGKCFLNANGKFCCQGVLCELAGVPRREPSPSERYVTYEFGEGEGRMTSIPADFLGVSAIKRDLLAEMNDTGKTFAKIATWIEKNL